MPTEGRHEAGRLLLSERLRGGQMWSRVVRRSERLTLTDPEGGGTAAALFFNAKEPLERYNMPDTLKAQHIARLTKDNVLMSDMGRVLFSVVRDDAGWHDTITGHLTRSASEKKFGAGSYQALRNDFFRNTRDNFLIELGKYGLGKRDLHANVNFFVKVVADAEGSMSFVPNATPGSSVELRAEMDVLVILSVTPHAFDPASRYAPKPVGVALHTGAPAAADDSCRKSCPEAERSFVLTEAYHL
jgi:urea carboxylase-associated protein 2